MKEVEEKRNEISTKFQSALNDVAVVMTENTDKSIKLKNDNLKMTNKMKSIKEEFKKQEEQIKKMNQQIELEKQLAEAQITKLKIMNEMETQKLNSNVNILKCEKAELMEEVSKANEKCRQLQMTVKSLQDQIQRYSLKYNEFEATISRSNEIFDNCKEEIKKMRGNMINLEQENKVWRANYQKLSKFNNDILNTRTAQQEKIKVLENQVKQFMSLCRALQNRQSIPDSTSTFERNTSENAINKVPKQVKRGKKSKVLQHDSVNILPQVSQVNVTQEEEKVVESSNIAINKDDSDDKQIIDIKELHEENYEIAISKDMSNEKQVIDAGQIIEENCEISISEDINNEKQDIDAGKIIEKNCEIVISKDISDDKQTGVTVDVVKQETDKVVELSNTGKIPQQT